jgi:hypothetical protein
MKWLVVTLALLAASTALVAGITLRDLDTSAGLPQRTIAHSDALSVAADLGGTCPRGCAVRLLGHPRADHWTERIEVYTVTECVDIDVRTFANDELHGLSGVTKVDCDGALR